MTDLLLIEAPYKTPMEKKTEVPPLGLAYIAAVAENAGFSVEIFDMNIRQGDLSQKIKDTEIVGISCYTQNYDSAKKILGRAKNEDKKVLIGGPHATPLYKEMLQDGFDYVIRGEGEYPVLEFLKGHKSPKGLSFMEKGIPKANFVSRVKDLDSLPLPARSLLDLKSYSFPGAIATTRGCASHCIFCSSRNQSGCLRSRSVESLKMELEDLKSRGIESFFVTDPNFAFDSKRAIKFSRVAKELEMKWYSELRLDHVNDEVIKAMAGSGCRVVRFGVESGSQKVVNHIRKGIDLSYILKIVISFNESGVIPVCGFMVGHPTETREDFERTLTLAKKIINLGGEVTFSIQTPYPGTYLYNNATKLGVRIISREWSDYHHLNPVMETENLSSRELREMLFDALIKTGGVEIPNIDIKDGDEQEIIELAEGFKRRSFRNVCLDF